MTASDGFTEFLHDALAPLGPIRIKRMFGGAGIFADDLMFALVADDTLYFKVDAETEPRFAEEDLERFGYEAKGRRMELSYRRAPERLLDDGEEMCDWARMALAAARRAAAAKPRQAKAGARAAPSRTTATTASPARRRKPKRDT